MGSRMRQMRETEPRVSRRDFLRAAGVAGAVGVSGGLLGAHAKEALGQDHGGHAAGGDAAGGRTTEMDMSHGGNGTAGDVDLSRFDPTEFLRDFDYGGGAPGGGGAGGG